MVNIFNQDFQDFLSALNEANVKYVLVGGYAVIIHGYHRSTGDLDIWVERSESNYGKIVSAFKRFGMPVFDMTLSNFLEGESDVFTFGKPPISIDLMVELKGLDFDETFKDSEINPIEGLDVRVISLNQLLKAKAAAGRFKDKDDIEKLSEEI